MSVSPSGAAALIAGILALLSIGLVVAGVDVPQVCQIISAVTTGSIAVGAVWSRHEAED